MLHSVNANFCALAYCIQKRFFTQIFTVNILVPMDMDSCLQLQASLENVFGHIINLNEELGKPMPVVKASVIHDMASEGAVSIVEKQN